MRRRDFITVIAGSAAAWPLAVRAQPGDRMRRIGVLMPLAADDPVGQARLGAFQQGLQQSGWTDGHNVRIEYRRSAGNAADTRKYAAELVALAPDVILSSGTEAVAALQQATRTTPIVFTIVVDPVGAGLVDSLARPGGNATGFITFEFGISGKWLELLRQIVPAVKRVAVIRDPAVSVGVGRMCGASPRSWGFRATWAAPLVRSLSTRFAVLRRHVRLLGLSFTIVSREVLRDHVEHFGERL